MPILYIYRFLSVETQFKYGQRGESEDSKNVGLKRLIGSGSLGELLLIQNVEVLRVIYRHHCLLPLVLSVMVHAESISLNLSCIVHCIHLDNTHSVDLGQQIFDLHFRLTRRRSQMHHSFCCQVITIRHHLQSHIREPNFRHGA